MSSKLSRTKDPTPRTNSADPVLDEAMNLAHDIADPNEPEHPVPKPIVSIHGHDVREEELDLGKDHRRRNHHKAA